MKTLETLTQETITELKTIIAQHTKKNNQSSYPNYDKAISLIKTKILNTKQPKPELLLKHLIKARAITQIDTFEFAGFMVRIGGPKEKKAPYQLDKKLHSLICTHFVENYTRRIKEAVADSIATIRTEKANQSGQLKTTTRNFNTLATRVGDSQEQFMSFFHKQLLPALTDGSEYKTTPVTQIKTTPMETNSDSPYKPNKLTSNPTDKKYEDFFKNSLAGVKDSLKKIIAKHESKNQEEKCQNYSRAVALIKKKILGNNEITFASFLSNLIKARSVAQIDSVELSTVWGVRKKDRPYPLHKKLHKLIYKQFIENYTHQFNSAVSSFVNLAKEEKAYVGGQLEKAEENYNSLSSQVSTQQKSFENFMKVALVPALEGRRTTRGGDSYTQGSDEGRFDIPPNPNYTPNVTSSRRRRKVDELRGENGTKIVVSPAKRSKPSKSKEQQTCESAIAYYLDKNRFHALGRLSAILETLKKQNQSSGKAKYRHLDDKLMQKLPLVETIAEKWTKLIIEHGPTLNTEELLEKMNDLLQKGQKGIPRVKIPGLDDVSLDSARKLVQQSSASPNLLKETTYYGHCVNALTHGWLLPKNLNLKKYFVTKYQRAQKNESNGASTTSRNRTPAKL